jgi:hypothetical protein
MELFFLCFTFKHSEFQKYEKGRKIWMEPLRINTFQEKIRERTYKRHSNTRGKRSADII